MTQKKKSRRTATGLLPARAPNREGVVAWLGPVVLERGEVEKKQRGPSRLGQRVGVRESWLFGRTEVHLLRVFNQKSVNKSNISRYCISTIISAYHCVCSPEAQS